MTSFNKTKLLLFLPLFMVFFSCFARIDGAVKDGGAADLKLKISIGPGTTAIIRSLRFFMGEGPDAPLLDGPAIARSLALAPGIDTATFRNSGPQALDGTISISNIGDFLLSGENRFISFAEDHGTSSIVLTLDRESAPALISRLSPEAEDYLSALMAPAVTGEAIGKDEYLSLVASIYGKTMAEEISIARISALIEFPRPVKTVNGGKSSGRQAEFDVPLLDVLVLDQSLRYEVSW